MKKISKIFFVKRGKGRYKEHYEQGNTPLISASNIDNGVIALVDAKPTFKAPALTVERVSGQAFVQLIDFVTVPDDMAVLIPKEKMELSQLFQIAAEINRNKWKFNYSRKLTPKRLGNLEIFIREDEKKIELKKLMPSPSKKTINITKYKNFSRFNVCELFDIERGDFHALDRLEPGIAPTISRVADDNGLVGFYRPPKGASIYPKNTITISTVSGDAFIQLHSYIATDNVLICKSKKPLQLTTLFFITAMLNMEKWRFSYGRQPYLRIFQKTTIYLPIRGDGSIDEDSIYEMVSSIYGWNHVLLYLKN